MDADFLRQHVNHWMGNRQTQNFEHLTKHLLRTNKELFPFLYSCLMHYQSNENVLKECELFKHLVSYFATPQAPKLTVRVVHLLFVVDFFASIILNRYRLVDSVVTNPRYVSIFVGLLLSLQG